MSEKSQAVLVENQFGSRAAAYLTSTVHAQGEDLQAIAAMVQGHADVLVLDLGCGAGHVSFTVAPHVAAVTACDLSASMLEVVARAASDRGLANISVRRSTAESLPFADGEFDFVISRYSAHHWHDLAAGLGEARRVLRPGGSAVFIDVISRGTPLLDTFLQAIELLRDPSHVRNYSQGEWEQRLVRAGFVPGAATHRRLPLDFATWVKRMATPETHIAAIRSLQQGAPREVTEHLAIEADGSFSLDTMTLEAATA